jgi:hypothetical protein
MVFFFQTFFLSNASKLEMILTLLIIKAKALEIKKIHFKMHLNMFVSNVLSTLKIMKLEKCDFNKKLFIFVLFKT